MLFTQKEHRAPTFEECKSQFKSFESKDTKPKVVFVDPWGNWEYE